MKDNKIIIAMLHVLQLILRICVAVTSLNFVLHGFMHYEQFQLINTFYIAIAVLVCYLARVLLKNGKLVYIVHVIMSLLPAIVLEGELEDKMLVIVITALFAMYSMKKADQKPIIFLELPILVACYCLASSIQATSAYFIPYYATVIYLIGYFLWFNLSNLNYFMGENATTKSFNTQQFVNVNTIMLTVFMAVCIIAMYIMPKLHLQVLIWGAIGLVWKAVAAVLRMLMPEISDAIEEAPDMLKTQFEDDISGLPALPMTEGSMVLNVIAIVFAIIIAVFMLIMLIKALKDIKYRTDKGYDKKEFISPKFFKQEADEKKKWKLNEMFSVTNDMAIRRVYKKSILKRLNQKGIAKSDTPYNLTNRAYGNQEQKSLEITDLYEMSRYSNESISDKQVKQIKELLK